MIRLRTNNIHDNIIYTIARQDVSKHAIITAVIHTPSFSVNVSPVIITRDVDDGTNVVISPLGVDCVPIIMLTGAGNSSYK